jgi:hypothetical protein
MPLSFSVKEGAPYQPAVRWQVISGFLRKNHGSPVARRHITTRSRGGDCFLPLVRSYHLHANLVAYFEIGIHSPNAGRGAGRDGFCEKRSRSGVREVENACCWKLKERESFSRVSRVRKVDSGNGSPYGPPVNSEQVPPSLRFGAFYLSLEAFSHVQHNFGGCPMGR